MKFGPAAQQTLCDIFTNYRALGNQGGSVVTVTNGGQAWVGGPKVFYREHGPEDTLTLTAVTDGSRAAAHLFRNLTRLLGDQFRVIVPDLAGSGQSDMPSRDSSATINGALKAFAGTVDTGFPKRKCDKHRLWSASRS